MHLWCVLTAAVFIAVDNHRSFVDAGPIDTNQDLLERNTQLEDSSVKELENLKHSLGKTLAMMKSQSIELAVGPNGHKDVHADIKEQVNSNDKLIARVNQHIESEAASENSAPNSRIQTEIDVPEKNIHHTVTEESGQNPVITDNGSRRNVNQEVANTVNKYNSYSGVQYSPLDMAEYVFWTGDEKGVTMAIEEFLQEGLMTREEAISFLQEIKYNLDYLQTHYSQQGLYAQEHTKERPNTINQYAKLSKLHGNSDNINSKNNQYDLSDFRQDISKKSLSNDNLDMPKRDTSVTDEDYDELLEKLRVADFLYTEYSLEEVIYQLSKIMFIQSLKRGSAEAQAALQKFTNFLETEAEEGHISRALEKKVLDVLIAALTDTLTEHPELVAAAREGLGGSPAAPSNLPDGNRILRKLLKLGSLDNATIKAALSTYKEQPSLISNNGHIEPVHSKIAPIGFGKYKTP